MKLLHRMTIAFGILLIIVTGATAWLIHSLLLDNLIEQQRKELLLKGKLLAQQLDEWNGTLQSQDFTKVNRLLISSRKVEVLVIGQKKRVLFSTLPAETLNEWVERIDRKEAKRNSKDIWSVGDSEYIVVTVRPEGEGNIKLLLATPVRGLKDIRIELTEKIVAILAIGAASAIAISYVITRSLVNPLTSLQKELKKVQLRRFSEVQPIPAKGEIGDVSRSVYEMARELGRFHEIQKQFFQNASHELKTPLMSIQGYAEGIRDEIFTGEAAREGLDVIVQEASRLKGLVTEMILLAKLESEEDIFHPVDVSVDQLAKQAIERLNPFVVKRNIQVKLNVIGTVPVVRLDPDKFLQALLNILGNALRYADRTVEVTITSEGGGVQIDIADDGAGISAELLPVLFHRFMKGKDGENGLGLAISRAIIERCGGTVQASNREQGGAVFRIHLS
jgi:signal transduction histidine kinase